MDQSVNAPRASPVQVVVRIAVPAILTSAMLRFLSKNIPSSLPFRPPSTSRNPLRRILFAGFRALKAKKGSALSGMLFSGTPKVPDMIRFSLAFAESSNAGRKTHPFRGWFQVVARGSRQQL